MQGQFNNQLFQGLVDPAISPISNEDRRFVTEVVTSSEDWRFTTEAVLSSSDWGSLV